MTAISMRMVSLATCHVRLCLDQNVLGEALYRFVLDHASETPSLLLKCKGTHTEWRTRQVTRYEDGRNVSRTETSSETIVDFDFTIDISSAVLPEPLGAPIWIVGDKDAAYRGRRSLEIDSTPKIVIDGDHSHPIDMEPGIGPFGRPRTWRRRATVTEQNASDAWAQRRSGFGYAPWVFIRGQIRGLEATIQSEEARVRMINASRTVSEHGDIFDDSDIRLSTRNLRDWADEYCESRRILKEFEFKKVLYGWNMAALRQAVETTIRGNSVHYDQPAIDFILQGDTIAVKADNKLSRMLSKTWVLVLLWITLIYPLVIWPFSKFNSRGAGKWKVAGSAFGLTKWVHQGDSHPGETPEDYLRRTSGSPRSATGNAFLKATPRGISRLEGIREGEWFSQWEETIGSLVRQRYISPVPMTVPLHSPKTAGLGLDGYTPRV